MTQAKVKVSYLDDRGTKKTKTVKYEFPPEVKEQVIHEFDGTKFDPPLVSPFETNAALYLDDTSFGGTFMAENPDCAIVLDYVVLVKKGKPLDKQIMEEFLNTFDTDQAKIDFLAVYNKMAPTLKGMPIIKKIRIVMQAQGAAYESATNAYANMAAMLKNTNDKVIGNGKIKSVR